MFSAAYGKFFESFEFIQSCLFN